MSYIKKNHFNLKSSKLYLKSSSFYLKKSHLYKVLNHFNIKMILFQHKKVFITILMSFSVKFWSIFAYKKSDLTYSHYHGINWYHISYCYLTNQQLHQATSFTWTTENTFRTYVTSAIKIILTTDSTPTAILIQTINNTLSTNITPKIYNKNSHYCKNKSFLQAKPTSPQ